MSGVRVTSEFWVSALKKKLELKAIPIFVIQKGDKQAGAIIIRVSDMIGNSKIFVQVPSHFNDRRWVQLADGRDVEIEEIVNREKKFDKDAWILEVEELKGINFIDEFLLSAWQN